METVSLLESFSSDWLMLAGFVFVLPKVLFGTFALVILNADRVPFLDRLLGDRVAGLKQRLKQRLSKSEVRKD